MPIPRSAVLLFKWLNSTICGVSSKVTELPEAPVNVMLLSVMGNAESWPLDVLVASTATLVVPAGLGEGEGAGDMFEPQPTMSPKRIIAANMRKADNEYAERDGERNRDAIL